MKKFFFYGTLRKGCPMATILLKTSNFIKTASVKGSLFVMDDGYPIISLDEKGNVVGDIFEVDEITIERLDEYEDIYDGDSPYERIKINLDGEEVWTYAIKESHKNKMNRFKRINSGDWLEYLKKQRKRIG